MSMNVVNDHDIMGMHEYDLHNSKILCDSSTLVGEDIRSFGIFGLM